VRLPFDFVAAKQRIALGYWMAVDFSLLPPQVPVPDDAPSPFVWSIVFVALTLGGVAFVLWSWPPHEKTQTAWFWICSAVLPPCVAGALVLRRFARFHQHRNRLQAENALSKTYADMVFNVASEPLAVLASAFRVHAADKENTFEALVARSSSPPTRPAKESREMILASCLEPAAAALAFDDAERQAAVLKWLLGLFVPIIADTLRAVPSRIPLAVHLNIGGTVLLHEAIEAVWNELPAAVRPAHLDGPPTIGPTLGLWMIDTLLDRTDPLQRDVVTVLISANLNAIWADDPPSGSAEAACMMLMCPAALARTEKLQVGGWIHRPQKESASPSGAVVRYALRWGRVTGALLGGTVQTGFDENMVGRVRVALVAEGRTGSGSSSADVALDTLVGNTATTAQWLAATLALNRANTHAAPFLAGAQSEGDVLLAVVAPGPPKITQNAMDNE
jgi:hypothetical protein